MLALLLILIAGFVPPLTDADQIRIDLAIDHADYRDDAFVALATHARTWTDAVPGAAPVRLAPDLPTMIAQPATHRGDLCRLEGVLQQAAAVDPGYGSMLEWFVRPDDGPPFIVYVPDAAELRLEPGDRIRVLARYYKPITLDARDGHRRTYAAFVGAFPVRSAVAGGAPVGLILAIGGMGVAFVLLLWITRRGRAERPVGVGRDRAPVDATPDLPDDPADALAELRRRAEPEDP